MRHPIKLPPVFVREQRDGSLLWPGASFNGVQTYSTIREMRDLPPARLDPPTITCGCRYPDCTCGAAERARRLDKALGW